MVVQEEVMETAVAGMVAKVVRVSMIQVMQVKVEGVEGGAVDADADVDVEPHRNNLRHGAEPPRDVVKEEEPQPDLHLLLSIQIMVLILLFSKSVAQTNFWPNIRHRYEFRECNKRQHKILT